MPASGSSTSPVPVSTSDTSLSATIIIASSRRRKRSVRQSLASSTAARVSWPGYCSSFDFQPLEQGEGVGRGAGKAADHVAAAEPAHLLGIGLDDGLADRDLAVAADRDQPALADGQDGGAVPEACDGGRIRRLHALEKPSFEA